jgi:hypothetical protein
MAVQQHLRVQNGRAQQCRNSRLQECIYRRNARSAAGSEGTERNRRKCTSRGRMAMQRSQNREEVAQVRSPQEMRASTATSHQECRE